MRRLRIFCLVILLPAAAYAQQSALKVQAEVPLQFGIGYESRLSNRFSFSLQVGLLTQPNSTLIVNILEAMGTDEQIALMIDNAFDLGVVGEAGINYNFRKNYFGTFVQIIGLQAGDTPTELIETYYGEDISSYPAKRRNIQTEEVTLSLRSTLVQAGVLYGRRFPLANKHFEIDAEFGISANIGSQSKLNSNDRDLQALSAEVDDELHYYYSHYAFVPSLTVALAYKFHP